MGLVCIGILLVSCGSKRLDNPKAQFIRDFGLHIDKKDCVLEELFNNYEGFPYEGIALYIPMVFGPRELSKILGISKNKTYEVVNRYDFPKIRVGRRIIISKKHFLEWMDANFGKERNNT